ncbi:MAG TPA: gas vesicle accessory protein GvpU [Bacillales bacterium]|nr:gas vesicle accessory protein GvpU [Bacillales bacterium]
MNPEGQSKDSILEFFVEAANQNGFSLDITLNMKGSVVTGTTISAKEYFELLSEKFDGGKDIAQELSEQLAKASEAAEESHESGANFIHLKNTRIYLGDSQPTPSKGKIVWRGKLNEIDGFFLGKISESKNKGEKK